MTCQSVSRAGHDDPAVTLWADCCSNQCVDDVKRVVAGIQGVEGCEVDLAKKQVVVTGKGTLSSGVQQSPS